MCDKMINSQENSEIDTFISAESSITNDDIIVNIIINDFIFKTNCVLIFHSEKYITNDNNKLYESYLTYRHCNINTVNPRFVLNIPNKNINNNIILIISPNEYIANNKYFSDSKIFYLKNTFTKNTTLELNLDYNNS